MTDINRFTKEYYNHLAIENYASGTIKGHTSSLNRFIDWLKDSGIQDITAVTKDVIREYQTYLYQEINSKGQPNTTASQNNRLSAVKSFFKYLCENDYLVGDPAKCVTYARQPKRLPRSILTKSETRKLLKMPDTKTALGYRNRTILEVLYSTGIRREEISNLMLQDVDYNDGFIRINLGKGKKDRIVPIGKIACRYIENYIKAVRPELIRDPYNNHLFLSLKGNKLSKNMIWEIVKEYGHKAKLKKSITPHTFRHTCATLMLRNKANIRHIQEMLGHASLDSTQIYTSVSITDLKEVHNRCHPREKDKE